MVVGTMREPKETTPWRVVIRRIVTFAAAMGVGFGCLARDWAFGVMVGGIFLAIPVGCVLLNVLLGLICIPLMMLAVKLIGDRGPESRRAADEDGQT